MAGPTISPADRIRELSAINADVAALLKEAGLAIDSLTNRPLKKTDDDDVDMTDGDQVNASTLDERKEGFMDHTRGYYSGLQAVVARLRRQAYALEEAGIISAESPTLSTSAPTKAAGGPPVRGLAQAAAPSEPERITNGGLGNLDVGWLNSRGNKVGAEKESELFAEAKEMLHELLKE